MSSREPMWYCHECRAEMRPIMSPDPHCASCSGTFLEKLDNPQDDPREFNNATTADALEFDNEDPWPFSPFSMIPFLANDLRSPTPSQNRSSSPMNVRTSRSVRLELGGPNGHRTVILGGPNVLNRRDSQTGASGASGSSRSPGTPPRLSEFVRENSGRADGTLPRNPNISGDLMAQYLMALLGGGLGMRSSFFGPLGEGLGTESGRMGDYVFTQEALDQIITQLMEGNSTRPVPATQEIMDELPRTVLEEGSTILEKECAVCKDQFSAKAEEPDEQVVITLPCSHVFHEGCILPWLKSSGTCPVCRHALVPQPNAHPPGGGPSGSTSPPANSSNDSTRPSNGGSSTGGTNRSGNNNGSGSGSHGHGILNSLFNTLAHPIHGGSPSEPRPRNNSSSHTSHSRSPTRHRRLSRDNHPPGAWRD